MARLTGDRNEHGSDETRRLVVEAARQLLRSEGISAVTMTAVAERAGVARATLHRYFRTKHDLCDALDDADSAGTDDTAYQSESGRPVALRRGDGRGRLLRAARLLFARHGFSATSIQAIADEAGLSQPMIYRYFASKESLFQEATITPLNEFIDEYINQTNHGSLDLEPVDYARQFCGSLYDLMRSEKDLLLTLIWMERDGRSIDESSPMSRLFAHFLALMDQGVGSQTRGASGVNGPLLCRLSFGLILAAALHSTWIIGETYSREEIVEEMTSTLVYGIYRPRIPARELRPGTRGV